MFNLLKTLAIVTFSVVLFGWCTTRASHQDQPTNPSPNVLFIAVDDLRPELGTYGKEYIHSPNIDRLAASGVTFRRAYCNVPVCGASRASMLSGVRPTYHRFRHYYSQADVEVPNLTTLPEQFKNHGYRTVSIGKIFHTPADSEEESWSDTPFRLDHHLTEDSTWSGAGWQNYLSDENQAVAEAHGGYARPWERIEVADTAYYDGQYARRAVEYLKEFKDTGEPFFLALGFLKPHLPFNAPQKYWNQYVRDEIDLADNPYLPKNAPEEAVFNWGELRAYYGIPNTGPVSDSVARTLLHGYYACVSYTDALVGEVLDALEEQGLADNTVIVLFGDHGWNLGEHSFWCKHVNFKTALQTTLMLSGPGISQGEASGVVELVDLYPTLLEVCALPNPSHLLEGSSLVPMLNDPGASVKDFALGKYQDGVTYLDDRYFYTEWHDAQKNTVARMLYDHQTDPHENVNIADRPANAALVKELSQKLTRSLSEDYWSPTAFRYPSH